MHVRLRRMSRWTAGAIAVLCMACGGAGDPTADDDDASLASTDANSAVDDDDKFTDGAENRAASESDVADEPGDAGEPANRAVTPSELTIGMCLVTPSSDVVAQFNAVDCELEHELEVIEIVDLDNGSDTYPGRESLQEAAYLVCEGPAFSAYVGSDYQVSSIYVEAMVPTPDAWASNNRDAYCMGYVPGERLVGTVRASNL